MLRNPAPVLANSVMPESSASRARVHTYLENGFLVVPELLNAHELAELGTDLIELARGGYASTALPPVSLGVSDAEALNKILCIHQPHAISPVIQRYLSHPRVLQVLSEIVGAHLGLLWDGSVKCMQSMFFGKPAGKPGQAWHQDEGYIPTRDRSLCGAWIALDTATVENGCLWVLPGSQRRGVLYPVRSHAEAEFDSAPMAYGFEESAEVPVEVPAGTVVFFNGYLLHRSKKNGSSRARRALVSHYMTGQSLLPWGVEREGAYGLLDNRRVLIVVGKDPYGGRGTVPFDQSQVHLRRETSPAQNRPADGPRPLVEDIMAQHQD
jgi:phytanoyl-CoA hydroxylase